MSSRAWILLVCIHWFGVASLGQSPVKRQLVLQLSAGGYIAFKGETSVTDNKQTAETQSLASQIYSQAVAGENHIIHRVLTDAERRVIFGYDLVVNADPVTRKFSVGVLPTDEAFRRTFLRESAQRTNDVFATFTRSAAVQTLDDGDAVSLELLVNRESGIKIVDVVRVTFDRSKLLGPVPESAPKDFTLDAVALSVKNYQLSIDNRLITRSKSTFGCAGALLWLYVPERGRFIFSLVPREGYAFEKIGVLDGNRIEFTLNGEYFEWESAFPILPNGGTWNLWVLFDPYYTPLFSSDKPFAKPPGILDKLGQVVGAGDVNPKDPFRRTPTTPGPLPQTTKKSQVSIKARVMVGGADSMDNLLPKSP